jgi:hypothetical protein
LIIGTTHAGVCRSRVDNVVVPVHSLTLFSSRRSVTIHFPAPDARSSHDQTMLKIGPGINPPPGKWSLPVIWRPMRSQARSARSARDHAYSWNCIVRALQKRALTPEC